MQRLQRHRIAIVLALAIAGISAAHARADTGDGTAAPSALALRDAVADAARQAAQGDTLGALIAFERLLASPALHTLSKADRLEAYTQAAWTALQTGQTGAARTYLQSARQLSPDEPRVLYLLGTLQPRQALETADAIGNNLSPYGEAVQQWVRFAAYRQLGDAARAEQAKAWLQAHDDVAAGYFLDALLEDNALDAAAAHLIGRLQSTQHRSDTLLSVQRFVTVPSLPGDAERDRRWWQVVARSDVQAALNTVGRSDAYGIVARGSSR